MEPQHFGKLDPGYPLNREKPHPDSQSSQKADLVPHQSKKLGSAKALHGAMKAHPGAVGFTMKPWRLAAKGLWASCGRFASLSWGPGSGSTST
jgi:hypothetical protein